MRIVHLVIAGDVAGGQAIALRLAQAARNRGDDVAFVVPEHGRFVELVRAEGMQAHLLPLRRTYQLGKAFRLARLLRGRADVLHTHTLAAANILGRAAARLAGVPVISHLHIENHFRPATRPLLRSLDNATARLCARLVAVSDDTRRAYERQGYPGGGRIEVVYNGVELEGGRPVPDIRSELGVPPGVPLVGEVARLCDVKGQRELIEAVASMPDARLVLVGADVERGGAFQAELERHADGLGVRHRVSFAGHRDDAAELLGQLDVVALPSWTEGLPLVLLEAMARHRAVVATPVGGTPELVADGETGLLVQPRDPVALAAAISRLLADPDLRARMGTAGYRRVADRFSAEAMSERVLELYDEVVGR